MYKFDVYYFAKHVPILNIFLNCVCVCVCVCSTHRYCSAPLSIPGHTHTSPPYTLRSCCTVGGRPSGHTQFQSSPPRTDTHRHNRRHGCHSPLHTPLLERERKKISHAISETQYTSILQLLAYGTSIL